MTITNGYCTLNEFKQELLDQYTYTASTISFDTTADTVADTAYGLRRFVAGDVVQISGAVNAGNNGYFTLSSGNNSASFTVTGNLTNEVAGAAITIRLANLPDMDTVAEGVIEAVSRWIDYYTGRRYFVNTNDETRYYAAANRYRVYTDDIVSITTLQTDADNDGTYDDTWTATDYNLMPDNAALDGLPYSWLEIAGGGDFTFPYGCSRGVKIVGKFGFAAVPVAIKRACIVQAIRLYKRKDAPFGIAGSAEIGQLQLIPALDPDVKALLAPFVRAVP